MRHLVRMDAIERRLAVRRVQSWGYPRELHRLELDADWFGYRAPHYVDGFAWFLPIPDAPDGWLQVHACGRPGCGYVLGDAHGMRELERVARELGARRVYSVLPAGAAEQGIPVKAMRRYLRIRGWQSDDLGMYLEIKGE